MKSIDEYRIRELKAEVAKAYKRLHALEAAMLQLAGEWERLADAVHARRTDGVITDYENTLRENAEELRERAKGKP